MASATLTLTTAFTVEAWVRPTVDSGAARQIVQMPGGDGDGLRLSADGRPRFTAVFPSGSQAVTGPSILPIDAWTYLTLTYDGAVLRFYVNAAEVATLAVTGGVSGTDAMSLGRTRLGAAPLLGLLDQARIYARALTASEIALDLNTPIHATTPFQVSTTTPASNATGVITTPITAKFSKPGVHFARFRRCRLCAQATFRWAFSPALGSRFL